MRYKLPVIFFVCFNLILCASPQKKIEKARNKNPQYQYNMGLFYLNQGNVDEAIRYFKAALSLNPRYDFALYSLGLAHSMNGNFEESVKYLQNCLKVNPTLTDARNVLGSVYQEMGLIDQAERQFRIALSDENYKSRDNSYYNLARLYVAKEKLQEALDYVENALEINSRMAMAHNLKGIIFEKQNNFEKAIESYKKATEIVEDDVDFNFNLAVVYFKNNEFNKAEEIFKKISARVTDPEMKAKIDQYLKMIK